MNYLLLLSTWALAATFATKSIPNDFAMTPQDPKTVEISVVSAEQAKALFQKLAADKSIPFRYPENGCEDRATAMALIAEKENIIVGKIFIEGVLHVRTDLPLYPTLKFRRHVAPIVYVKPALGPSKLVVLDPSLFTAPVSVEELKARLLTNIGDPETPQIDEVSFSSRFQSHIRGAEPYKYNWDPLYLEEVRQTLKDYLKYEKIKGPQGPEYREGSLKKSKDSRVPAAKPTSK